MWAIKWRYSGLSPKLPLILFMPLPKQSSFMRSVQHSDCRYSWGPRPSALPLLWSRWMMLYTTVMVSRELETSLEWALDAGCGPLPLGPPASAHGWSPFWPPVLLPQSFLCISSFWHSLETQNVSSFFVICKTSLFLWGMLKIATNYLLFLLCRGKV